MPIVDGKHYAYTPEGIRKAKKARLKKKKGFWENVHVKRVKPIWFD